MRRFYLTLIQLLKLFNGENIPDMIQRRKQVSADIPGCRKHGELLRGKCGSIPTIRNGIRARSISIRH